MNLSSPFPNKDKTPRVHASFQSALPCDRIIWSWRCMKHYVLMKHCVFDLKIYDEKLALDSPPEKIQMAAGDAI